MNSTKLAIVIPYYNIKYFEQTLQSVANQSNKNFRLYIGNDASNDNPLPLIKKYFKDTDYLYYDYKENFGGKNLAFQWERILENIQEEWFQILGDDDIISVNFVDEFYQCLLKVKSQDISAIKFLHNWVNEENKTLEIFDYKTENINAVDFFIKKYRNQVKSSLSENIFETKKLRKYGFAKIPLAWGSDDLALLCFSDYKDFFYNRKSVVKVRISDSSISGSQNISAQKKIAYNSFRENVILKYAHKLPSNFVSQLIEEYLSFCHIEKQTAKFSIAAYFLKSLNLKMFVKTIKRIYYINKIAEAH